jgi:7-cyano-7-deazaguanine synthase
VKRAVLLSGGIDSIALANWKRPEVAFTIDYGQSPAAGEIRAATKVADVLGITHEVLRVDCSPLGSGDLVNRPPSSIAPATEWWPFRNQMLVTFAAMRGSALGVEQIMVGSVAGDAFHSDGTAEFYRRLDAVVNLQEGQIKVIAPALEMSSYDLIVKSEIELSLLSWAHSCHRGEFACGKCRGCNKHREVMTKLAHEPY